MDIRMPASSRSACARVDAGGSERLTHGLELLRLLERVQDLDELEQALLAIAVHPAGAGFSRAYLMLWNAASDRLEGWRWAREITPALPLAPALLELRRAGSRPEAVEFSSRWRAFSIAPAALQGVPAAAWTRGGTALGPGDHAELPWHGSDLGAAVLYRAGRPYALLVGAWDDPERTDTRQFALDELRQLAEAGADALARGGDSRRRAQHDAAIGELVRAGVSALNLAEALRLALRLATQGVAARGGALWLAQPGGALRLEVTHGAPGGRETLGRALQPIAESVVASGKARTIECAADAPEIAGEVAGTLSAVALLPFVAYGRTLGAFAVYDRTVLHPAEPPAFDRIDHAFLNTLCDLTALVVDQAQRFETLRVAEQQQRELRARIRRQERLATLGEMARRVAQEARNPLASIGAFARRVHRELAGSDPHREYLEIVMREADRLERMVSGQLELAAAEPPRLQLDSLNALVQESLQQCGETLVRRRIRLLKKLAPDVPPLLLDRARVQRVLNNIFSNALDAVAVGGRIRVESRRAGQFVVLDVAHDGPRHPGELLEELFVPFASARPGADGVGLGVAQQLVREHGGEIRLRSEGEWNTVFSLTLPVRENQDRRRAGGDRRDRRPDRRGQATLQ
jgi:signal transduction histidine kinase